MGIQAVAPPGSGDHFRWQPGEGLPAVLLRWPVMTGIEREVIEGFKALPKRGAEIGGALLGSRDPETGEFIIDGFEPIAIEHRSGPSYVPSDTDFELWRGRVAGLRESSPRFIGIYRSQTRPGLRIGPDDCAMVERFLPREEGVFLMVKPLSIFECIGAFYFCHGGAVVDEASASREFPFGRSVVPADMVAAAELEASEARATSVPSRRPTQIDMRTLAPFASTAVSPSIIPAASPRPNRFRLPSLTTPHLAVAAGIALALLVHYIGVASSRKAVPQELSSPASLRLRAQQAGSLVRLTWDASAPVIEDASRAVLSVVDGGAAFRRELTRGDLLNGYVTWEPHSGNIVFTIRVELLSQAALTESVRMLNSSYPINSRSDYPSAKPSPLSAASDSTGERRTPRLAETVSR